MCIMELYTRILTGIWLLEGLKVALMTSRGDPDLAHATTAPQARWRCHRLRLCPPTWRVSPWKDDAKFQWLNAKTRQFCWTSKSGSSLVFQLSFRIGKRESNRRSLMTTIIIKSITGLCGAHNYSEIQGVYAYKGDAITARYTGCLSVLASPPVT